MSLRSLACCHARVATIAFALHAAASAAVGAPAKNDSSWNMSAIADLDGDSRADVVWRDARTGALDVTLMDGAVVRAEGTTLEVPDADWRIVATGDFDGDGRSDLFWRHVRTGLQYVYLMNGISLRHAASPNKAPLAWNVVGSGDLDGDGKSDVLVRHATTGALFAYLMDGTRFRSAGSIVSSSDSGWMVVGVDDFDGDRRADILWRNQATGLNAIYFMVGTTISRIAVVNTVPGGWDVTGTPDLDGDGKADVVWRHRASGSQYVYRMNGSSIAEVRALPVVTDPAWRMTGVGDLDGDGKDDLVWRHSGVHADAVWLMNGPRVARYAFFSTRTWPVGTPESIVDALTINLLHTELVSGPGGERLYAYVPPYADEHPDTIATVDTRSGSVSFSGPIGIEPEYLVVSDDERYLYVAAEDAPAVVRFSLPEMVADQWIDLGPDPYDPERYGELHAWSVAVSPVDSTRIAVGLRTKEEFMGHRGVRVYEDGVRTATTPVQTQPYESFPDRGYVVFDAKGERIYTASYDSPDTIWRLAVEDGLLVEDGSFRTYAEDSLTSARRLSRAGERVITSGGTVIGTSPFEHEHDLLRMSHTYLTFGACLIVEEATETAACFDQEGSTLIYRVVSFYTLGQPLAYAKIPLATLVEEQGRLPRMGGPHLSTLFVNLAAAADGRFAFSVDWRIDHLEGEPYPEKVGHERIVIHPIPR